MIRYLFDSTESAAAALGVVLVHARGSKDDYTFGSLSLSQLTDSGMWLTGNTESVAKLLDAVPGAVRQESFGR